MQWQITLACWLLPPILTLPVCILAQLHLDVPPNGAWQRLHGRSIVIHPGWQLHTELEAEAERAVLCCVVLCVMQLGTHHCPVPGAIP